MLSEVVVVLVGKVGSGVRTGVCGEGCCGGMRRWETEAGRR